LKLSIIIPCFNEIKTIEKIIDKIVNLKDLDKEIIVIDDCSTDGSRELLKTNLISKIDHLILNEKNYGKGFCIIQAKSKISGDIVIIQDADLEYDPNDYYELIKPITMKKTNVVYGSRVLGKKRYVGNSYISISRIFFNHILTILSNILNSQNLTDAHTCYKVVKREIFDNIDLEEYSFSFCPELTTKLSKLNEKIFEIPINYVGREYNEGKKIKLKDGLIAIKALIKYRFFS
jgi:glycosyltransferase involved in cell wall biosynthesis